MEIDLGTAVMLYLLTCGLVFMLGFVLFIWCFADSEQKDIKQRASNI